LKIYRTARIRTRREEAISYCHDVLEQGDDFSKYEITEWYPED
jgi:hypothetical protein